jgi:hypothetical protein
MCTISLARETMQSSAKLRISSIGMSVMLVSVTVQAQRTGEPVVSPSWAEAGATPETDTDAASNAALRARLESLKRQLVEQRQLLQALGRRK